MERHQIENPDLKEYRAKECKSSKEPSPADIYDPSLGAWDVHHKKPAFVATPQVSSSTNALPLLQTFTMQAKLDRVGLANLFISPTSGGTGSSRACLIIQRFCGGLALKHGDSSAKSNEHWWG
jgi:hypothetical protein